MALAPDRREGLYTTLASAPMFAAKLLAGGLSGVLLQDYCWAVDDPPAEGRTAADLARAALAGIRRRDRAQRLRFGRTVAVLETATRARGPEHFDEPGHHEL